MSEMFEATLSADIEVIVTHPDRELTADERKHLGLPPKEE